MNANKNVAQDSEEAKNMHAQPIDLPVSTASIISVHSTGQSSETPQIPSTDDRTSSADKKTKTTDLENWLDSILDE